jgi:hypothetical protein
VCPSKNVECTSKAMEAVGSCRIVMRICESGDCYVHEFVSDDDSSRKKVLRHSYVDQLEKGTIDELPRYENGGKSRQRSNPMQSLNLSIQQLGNNCGVSSAWSNITETCGRRDPKS